MIVIREEHRSIERPHDRRRKPCRSAFAGDPPHRPRSQRPIEENDKSDFERSDAVQHEQHAHLKDDEEKCLCPLRKEAWLKGCKEPRGSEVGSGQADEGGNVTTKGPVLRIRDVLSMTDVESEKPISIAAG